MPVSVFLQISVQSVVIFIYSRNTNTVSNSDKGQQFYDYPTEPKKT